MFLLPFGYLLLIISYLPLIPTPELKWNPSFTCVRHAQVSCFVAFFTSFLTLPAFLMSLSYAFSFNSPIIRLITLLIHLFLKSLKGILLGFLFVLFYFFCCDSKLTTTLLEKGLFYLMLYSLSLGGANVRTPSW